MEPEKKSNGAFIGLIIIVIILLVGGIYIWMTNKSSIMPTPQNQTGTVTNQDSVALDALEQDVVNTDTNIGVDVNSVK